MASVGNKRLCIVVADEHAFSREAICLMLSRILPNAMVLDISSSQENWAIEPCCVNLLLFGLRPPYLKALDLLLNLRRHFPDAPLVFLSEVLDDKVTLMARARGASGLFHTYGSAEDLMATIRQALGGKPGFPPERHKEVQQADYHFSPRQVEVLDLLCKGKSNKEISSTLHMSGNTVRTHVAAIFNILGVHNRTEAVIFGHYLI